MVREVPSGGAGRGGGSATTAVATASRRARACCGCPRGATLTGVSLLRGARRIRSFVRIALIGRRGRSGKSQLCPRKAFPFLPVLTHLTCFASRPPEVREKGTTGRADSQARPSRTGVVRRL